MVPGAGGIALQAPAAGTSALDELVTHGWEPARSTAQDHLPGDPVVLACSSG